MEYLRTLWYLIYVYCYMVLNVPCGMASYSRLKYILIPNQTTVYGITVPIKKYMYSLYRTIYFSNHASMWFHIFIFNQTTVKVHISLKLFFVYYSITTKVTSTFNIMTVTEDFAYQAVAAISQQIEAQMAITESLGLSPYIISCTAIYNLKMRYL